MLIRPLLKCTGPMDVEYTPDWEEVGVGVKQPPTEVSRGPETARIEMRRRDRRMINTQMKRLASQRIRIFASLVFFAAALSLAAAVLLVFQSRERRRSDDDDFVRLLRLLPYNDITRASVFIFDDDELRRLFAGGDRLVGNGATEEFGGYTVLAGYGGVVSVQSSGYDVGAIRAEISSTDDSNPSAKVYEAVVGEFDPDAIRRATGRCDGCSLTRSSSRRGPSSPQFGHWRWRMASWRESAKGGSPVRGPGVCPGARLAADSGRWPGRVHYAGGGPCSGDSTQPHALRRHLRRGRHPTPAGAGVQ